MAPVPTWAVPLTNVLTMLGSRMDDANANSWDIMLPSMSKNAAGLGYTNHAIDGIKALNNNWYDPETGLWAGAWWNSANALTTLADFALLRPEQAGDLGIPGTIDNTFLKAQKTPGATRAKSIVSPNAKAKQQAARSLDEGVVVEVTESRSETKAELDKRLFNDFINDYYDDEGWWALAMIRSYDATNNQAYLDHAVKIFDDMSTGQGGPCGGGIFWSKDRDYVNAIANELYLSVAASLANRLPKQKRFLTTARKQWAWFQKSGMINPQGLINDGLDNDCRNNGLQTWTYNQGVVLGGLAELYRATGNADLLTSARRIANAALDNLTNKDGILIEDGGCDTQAGHCGTDGQQFKGVFMRNLRYLNRVAPDIRFRSAILRNAYSIWNNDRDGRKLGPAWAGPFSVATAQTQSSALDTIVAAIAAI